jgi:hypothetical protein
MSMYVSDPIMCVCQVIFALLENSKCRSKLCGVKDIAVI